MLFLYLSSWRPADARSWGMAALLVAAGGCSASATQDAACEDAPCGAGGSNGSGGSGAGAPIGGAGGAGEDGGTGGTGGEDLQCLLGTDDCNGDATDGCEVDLEDDPDHCGACGHGCGGGPCVGNACVPFTVSTGGAITAYLTTDADRVYWFATSSREIHSAALSGGEATLLHTEATGAPTGIAVGAGIVCWILGGVDGAVRCMPANGGAVVTVASGLLGPAEVAIHADSGTVFWALSNNAGAVWKGQTDGTGVTAVAPAETPVNGMVVDDAYVYWTVQGTAAAGFADGAIRRAPVTGGPATTLLANETKPNKLALGGDDLVWDGQSSAVLRRMPKAGGPPETVLENFYPFVTELAADETSIYWTANFNATVMRFDGQSTSQLSPWEHGALDVALAGDRILWSRQEAQTVEIRALAK